MVPLDELSLSLHLYQQQSRALKKCKPSRKRGTPAARRSAATRHTAERAVSDLLCLQDFEPLLRDPPGIVELGTLVENAVRHLGDLVLNIGPLVRRLADLFRQAATQASWPVQKLFSDLLVPTLVAMHVKKTKAFGILVAVTKALWAPADWPDLDAHRAATLVGLVSNHFLCGKELLTGTWFFSRLGLNCFASFDELYDTLADSIQALRMYCQHVSSDVQSEIVRRLASSAVSKQGWERRKKFTAAADLIQRFNLDRSKFPEVARHKTMCWLCYIVHRVPVHIAEDYATGDPELLALCVGQLARNDGLAAAASLYAKHRDDVEPILNENVLDKLLAAPPQAPETDFFGPSTADALTLPLGQHLVVWVDTPDLVSSTQSAVAKADVVGVDLEWSQLGDWLQPSLALMQIATPDCVYLVDLAQPAIQVGVAALMETMFEGHQPIVLGFAFHNDIRELQRSQWSVQCKQLQGVCDLQLLGGRPREGLASLVQRLLGKPLCKAEQRSYWHRRPLRAAQLHYAALDAYVLLQAASALVGTSLDDSAALASKLGANLAAGGSRHEKAKRVAEA